MADNADIAFELADAAVSRGLATIAADIPAGVAGECDDCGEPMPRLIDGRCGFCRDGRRPPLSFYADRTDAPPAPASTTKEHVPMTQTPPLASRKIAFDGPVLAAIEDRAATNDTSYKLAASELIEMALTPAPLAAPEATELSSGILSVADTDELFAELRARFDAAQANDVMEAALQAANARADAAEQKLADLKAMLG